MGTKITKKVTKYTKWLLNIFIRERLTIASRMEKSGRMTLWWTTRAATAEWAIAATRVRALKIRAGRSAAGSEAWREARGALQQRLRRARHPAAAKPTSLLDQPRRRPGGGLSPRIQFNQGLRAPQPPNRITSTGDWLTAQFQTKAKRPEKYNIHRHLAKHLQVGSFLAIRFQKSKTTLIKNDPNN